MLQKSSGNPKGFITALCAALVMGSTVWLGARFPESSQQQRDEWIKIVFGADGKKGTWDGNLRVSDGQPLAMSEWGLESIDQIDPVAFSWRIQTGLAKPERSEKWTASFAEPVRGILVKIRRSTGTRVHVTTQQGNFVTNLADLRLGRPTKVLKGRATVELLGREEIVAKTSTNDDFPSIAIDSGGRRWVAWVAYADGMPTSRLLVRNIDDPEAKSTAVTGAGEFSSLQLLNTADGLRMFWCSSGNDGNWDIYTSARDTQNWSPAERLTTAVGGDFHLAAAGGSSDIWLTWQSFRNGNSDVYAKCLHDGVWSKDVAIASGSANEWEPAIDVDQGGRAWIAYDTYEHGNYDVYLTSVKIQEGQPFVGERIAVARGEEFEAHASVLADNAGRVWVAFDKAGSEWGRDSGYHIDGQPMISSGEPPHRSRRLELRCWKEGGLHIPSVSLPQKALLPEGSRFYEYPQLVNDSNGRLWIFFRMNRQGNLAVGDKGNLWEIFATTYTSEGWLEPIQLPRSAGRQNQRVSVIADAHGRLNCAWAEGNHSIVRPDRKFSVHHGTLPEFAASGESPPLKAIDVEPARQASPKKKPPWTIDQDNKKFRLFFGDLHRHTNISICLPRVDGCQTDAHRYALDAAELDFLAITDHTHDLDSYAWWRTQLEADRFHVPGRYVPIYAYERSNYAPGGGHRNVFFLERGWEINGSDYYYRYHSELNLEKPNTAPDKSLYPWLKQRGGAFTIAHSPVYSQTKQRGTWDFNDPEVEPVAEIYQGYRRAFERPRDGVREEESLWYALSKGYRLGFIASSDHKSTHISYACVWAEQNSREALFEAIKSRRTYAATDRIVLDVRLNGRLMGEEVALGHEKPTLHIRATGTAPINEVQVIRSARIVQTYHPKTQDIDLEFTDRHPLEGESYYYVRLRQRDGNVAWGSPIWVKR